MEQRLQQKGISLIVLVITIIVMIILAGVIIISLTNGNVIEKAKLARDLQDLTQIREVLEIEKANAMLTDIGFNQINADNVNAKIPDRYKEYIEVGPDGTITLIKDFADEKMTDLVYETLGIAIPEPYIPVGFVASTASGEDSTDNGLVIYEGTEPVNNSNVDIAKATRNQFVWIPVKSNSEFVRIGNFSTFAALTDASYKSYNSASTTETAEYNAMRASVSKYKGFYISRYEAGKALGSIPATDGTEKPLSQFNLDVWNTITWDEAYVYPTLGNDANNGAVKIARSMYPAISATTEGMPVSTLVYGEQWDATMRYMKDVTNVSNIATKYITNSTEMGVYTIFDEMYNPIGGQTQVFPTGSLSGYRDIYDDQGNVINFEFVGNISMVKNIYDMGGNVSEWTMEVAGTSYRVVRGGDYACDGASRPAMDRSWRKSWLC